MISYELALKLKEAGFKHNWCSTDDCSCLINGVDSICFPTLSELIDACKKKYDGHFNMGGFNTWWALMRDKKNSLAIVPVQLGNTPKEAVANLWLALNKHE